MPGEEPGVIWVFFTGCGLVIRRSQTPMTLANSRPTGKQAERVRWFLSPLDPMSPARQLDPDLHAVFFERHIANADVAGGVNQRLFPHQLRQRLLVWPVHPVLDFEVHLRRLSPQFRGSKGPEFGDNLFRRRWRFRRIYARRTAVFIASSGTRLLRNLKHCHGTLNRHLRRFLWPIYGTKGEIRKS